MFVCVCVCACMCVFILSNLSGLGWMNGFFFLFQSGQAYFINDGVSVNVFEWLNPLVSNYSHLLFCH